MIDPATGQPLPDSDSSYQRILFVTNSVHVYGIPPITSNKGFSAGSWTSPTQPTAKEIFTARLRVIETTQDSQMKVDIALEDSNTGDLFAAAPYTSSAVVQQANDSSRFFVVRVQGERGMKATLGVGFKDRSPAFDFSIALTEARKVLGMEGAGESGLSSAGRSGHGKGKGEQESKVDFSLKEGEKIHIQVGAKGRRPAPGNARAASNDGTALFSIAPPPPAGKSHDEHPHPVPPSDVAGKSAKDLGFDDGEFGEFQ
ncbi:hypothetical protein LTR29_003892 [Friedmanniomyces endolithicus]|nr:hypothetical protein LTR29_003892 [Friedmanniomyces endolithicus]